MRARSIALVLTVSLSLLPAATSSVLAATTGIAADELVFDSDRTGNYEIYAVGIDTAGLRQLTDDPAWDSWWPKISPDRSQIVFHRTPAGTHDTDYGKTSTWLMDSDGSNVRQIIPNGANGWYWQGHVEWSPDGQRLAVFAGPRNTTEIWVTDADGTDPQRITRRGGNNIDPSWHPDGDRLLFIGCPIFLCTPLMYEVYEHDLTTGTERRITDDLSRDHDPYYSPDGSTIAFLRLTGVGALWSVMQMAPDGSGMTRVADAPVVNSKPAWSADSQWIYFHRTPLGRTRYSLFKVRPDGTQMTEILPAPTGFGDYDDEFPHL